MCVGLDCIPITSMGICVPCKSWGGGEGVHHCQCYLRMWAVWRRNLPGRMAPDSARDYPAPPPPSIVHPSPHPPLSASLRPLLGAPSLCAAVLPTAPPRHPAAGVSISEL